MRTRLERIIPNEILSINNLTGSVTNIQDDPDSPDGNWITTLGQNSNVNIRIGFEDTEFRVTPNTTQEFKFYVRKSASGGNTVTYNVRLLENGTLRATSETYTISATETRSFTWNSNLLTSSSFGQNVEFELVQLTGGTGDRRHVEIGAVEWNANTVFPNTILTT
jgi:hypothetical protein